MPIFEAFWPYGWVLLVGFGAGVVGSAVGHFGLWRSCRNLRVRVADLEERVVQVRNREYANKRWGTKEMMEQELRALETREPVHTGRKNRQFDNDPLEY